MIHTRYWGFADEERVDGHGGHVTIDFGGQWVMARVLTSGHGKELYHRPIQWQIVWASYPRDQEAPDAEEHDAESLLASMMGEDDPIRGQAVGAGLLPLASSGPLASVPFIRASVDWLSADRIEQLSKPIGPDEIGGALYPPVHAMLFAPLALDDQPRDSFRMMQWILLGSAFLSGLGVSLLSRGRFWWPLAASLTMAYPGFRGALDLGQNAPISLCLLVWGWVLMARGRSLGGGVVWGFLAFKPIWAVSFFVLLVLMRRWRAVVGMAACGGGLILATLPLVGVQAWFDWLHVGQVAAAIYNVDENWVFLSRDLFGVPRRFLVDFTLPRAERDHFLAGVLGWALWLIVLEVTLRLYALTGQRRVPDTGPLPAFLLLAAWACSYRFMYYDALLSALALFVLLAEPGRFFRRKEIAIDARTVATANSVVLTLLAFLLLVENVLKGLDVRADISVGYFRSTELDEDGDEYETMPELEVSTGLRYPWDLVLLLMLWLWCGGLVLFARGPPPENG